MLKTYKTCNSTVRFLKYEFYNKLLGGERERERERERENYGFVGFFILFYFFFL